MKLHPIFTDRLVLPANRPVRIFGGGDKSVTVTLAEHTATAACLDGKWVAELPPMPYGGPFLLTVTDGEETAVCHDVHIGEVYLLAGQSNMQFSLAGASTPPEEWRGEERLRIYTCDRVTHDEPFCAADGWTTCDLETAGQRSALAYYIGQGLVQKKGVAIGTVVSYHGASIIESWLPEGLLKSIGIDIPPEQKHIDHWYEAYVDWNKDGVLYENLMRQTTPFAFSGVVWYQGESDACVAEGAVYAQELTALIDQWRADYKDEQLPFVVVQIADFLPTGESEGWKLVQAAQLKVGETVPFVKTVISRDISENDDIHPRTKDKLAGRIVDALTELTAR